MTTTRTLEGVRVLPLPAATGKSPVRRFEAVMPGVGVRPPVRLHGQSAGSWGCYLLRAAQDTRRGHTGRRLVVVGRADTETAIAARIRRELRGGMAADELVVFSAGQS